MPIDDSGPTYDESNIPVAPKGPRLVPPSLKHSCRCRKERTYSVMKNEVNGYSKKSGKLTDTTVRTYKVNEKCCKKGTT